MCVCVRDGVSVCARARMYVCVSVCVWVRERERVCVSARVSGSCDGGDWRPVVTRKRLRVKGEGKRETDGLH